MPLIRFKIPGACRGKGRPLIAWLKVAEKKLAKE